VDVAEVDAERHDQRHFGNEHQAEEKGQPAHGIVAALLEEMMIDLIEQHAGAIECRRQQQAADDRVDIECAVEDENGVSADDREGRMRDVDDIKKAEGDGGADAQCGIEAAH
jgi:hypothetical protein